MADPSKTSIWTERQKRVASRVYFQEVDGVVCVTTASANQTHYLVENGVDSVVALQGYLGTGSLAARRGSTDTIQAITVGTADVSDWYRELYFKDDGTVVELSLDWNDEDVYLEVVGSAFEFSATDPAQRTFVADFDGATARPLQGEVT